MEALWICMIPVMSVRRTRVARRGGIAKGSGVGDDGDDDEDDSNKRTGVSGLHVVYSPSAG